MAIASSTPSPPTSPVRKTCWSFTGGGPVSSRVDVDRLGRAERGPQRLEVLGDPVALDPQLREPFLRVAHERGGATPRLADDPRRPLASLGHELRRLGLGGLPAL